MANGYLERQKQTQEAWRAAERDTQLQLMTDAIILVLRDPEIMGEKGCFGKDRILKFVRGVSGKYDFCHRAIEVEDDADWYKKEIDEALLDAVGEENFTPFEKRYEFVTKTDYSGKKRR